MYHIIPDDICAELLYVIVIENLTTAHLASKEIFMRKHQN